MAAASSSYVAHNSASAAKTAGRTEYPLVKVIVKRRSLGNRNTGECKESKKNPEMHLLGGGLCKSPDQWFW